MKQNPGADFEPVQCLNNQFNYLFFSSSVKQKEYELVVHNLISSAQVIIPNDEFKTCGADPDFSISMDQTFESNVLFIKMTNAKDFETW